MSARISSHTIEYCIWIRKEAKGKELSGEGYYGLNDERENTWVHSLLNLEYEVSPYTMVYHIQSKSAPHSPPSENRKGKRKMVNNKVMIETIEEEHPSNELVSKLKQKIRELEEEISDMREWAKLLLYINPSLETNIDNQHVTN
ncbi:hypothetical protein KY284_035845 [Solanum tuberosum]|nr:hypothetical protein KY284_035845 [Solanum tuberosum]